MQHSKKSAAFLGEMSRFHLESACGGSMPAYMARLPDYPIQNSGYLMWQVMHRLLPELLIRKKVGRFTVPFAPVGTPCGSWHVAHST